MTRFYERYLPYRYGFGFGLGLGLVLGLGLGLGLVPAQHKCRGLRYLRKTCTAWPLVRGEVIMEYLTSGQKFFFKNNG